MTYGMTGCISSAGSPMSGRDTTIAPTRAASSSTRQHLERQHPGAEDLARRAARRCPPPGRSTAVQPERVDQQRGQPQPGAAADQHGRPAGPVEVVGGADRRAGQHHREQQQHHDRADVDQHLHPGHQLGGEHQVEAGHRAEADHQAQAGAHQVPGGDDEQRRSRPPPPPAPSSSTSAAVTVAALSWPRCSPPWTARRWGRGRAAAARWPSTRPAGPCRAAGRGCRTRRTRTRATRSSASNGQASMQIPQYMHSEKSMSKRSSTLRWRGRAAPGTTTSSLCESM